MNVLSNFGKTIANTAALVLAAQIAAQAQTPVESTHVDEKFAYTTVVYKNKAADDQAVLQSLDSSFGIGDVVRVTLAPPPPPKPAPILTASAPVSVKTKEVASVRSPSIYHSPVSASEPVYAGQHKGEETWLPAQQSVPQSLTSSAKPLDLGTRSVAPVAVPLVQESPESASDVQVQQVSAINLTGQSGTASVAAAKAERGVAKAKTATKSNKTASNSARKPNHGKVKMKARKHVKQRYGCPKF
jgi:hypothetical protein